MNSQRRSGKSSPQGSSQEALAQQYGGSHAGAWVGSLPPSWVPYIQLARLSPPAGLFLIYFPHFFGIILAAIIQRSPIQQVLWKGVLVLGASFFLSNASHAWNDLVDAPIDKSVARTSQRPIPRGAISPRAALVFTLTQTAGVIISWLLLPSGTIWYGLPYIMLAIYYPWAKRHTNYAQFVLGFCLAWGIFIGSSAMGLKPFTAKPLGDLREFWIEKSTGFLFLACILWTVIYDTIYAHQDVKDDIKLGLKSLAVLVQNRTKIMLWILLSCMLIFLVACGKFRDMGIWYYCFAVGGCLASLGAMITNVELKNSSSCWWWFRYGFWLAGGAISFGLLSEYMFNGSLRFGLSI